MRLVDKPTHPRMYVHQCATIMTSVCVAVCGARYKTRPGLHYHYSHFHNGMMDEDNGTPPPKPPGRASNAASGFSLHFPNPYYNLCTLKTLHLGESTFLVNFSTFIPIPYFTFSLATTSHDKTLYLNYFVLLLYWFLQAHLCLMVYDLYKPYFTFAY